MMKTASFLLTIFCIIFLFLSIETCSIRSPFFSMNKNICLFKNICFFVSKRGLFHKLEADNTEISTISKSLPETF